MTVMRFSRHSRTDWRTSTSWQSAGRKVWRWAFKGKTWRRVLRKKTDVQIEKEGEEKKWLNPELDKKKALSFIKSYPSKEMEAHEVSTYMNSPKNNTPKCIEPVKIGGLKAFMKKS